MTNEELIAIIRNKVERQYCAFLNLLNASQEYGYHKALEFVLSILSDIEESEKQEVDFDEEMDRFFEEMPVQEHENIFEDTYQMIARHFYELGKNSK